MFQFAEKFAEYYAKKKKKKRIHNKAIEFHSQNIYFLIRQNIFLYRGL